MFTFLVYLLKSLIANHWNILYLHSNNSIEPCDVNDVNEYTMALCNLIGHWWYHDLIDALPKLAEKLHVKGLLLQYMSSYKVFLQGFD